MPGTNSHHRWQKWVKRLGIFQRWVKSKLTATQRRRERAKISSTLRERERHRTAGKLSHFFDSVLGMERSKPLLSMQVKDENGEPRIITDPVEVAEESLDFFAAWMGKGRIRAYLDGRHLLNEDSPEGMQARIRVAEGNLTEEEMDAMGVEPNLRNIVREMARKTTKGGEQVHEGMFADMMNHISEKEWAKYWQGRMKGKTPGETGLTVEQIALMHPQGLEGLRVLANIIVETGDIGNEWCWETLVPIPKPSSPMAPKDKEEGVLEYGPVDRERLRPIKLQEELRKAVMGILMGRFCERAIELGIIHKMQFAFLPGSDTSLPLMGLKALTDYCNYHRIPICVLMQDIKHAYDSVERLTGKEMPLRRWGAPEKFIKLVAKVDKYRRTQIKTGHGLTTDILGQEAGRFEDECGWGQGGADSPLGWDCFFDVLLCAMDRYGGPALRAGGVRGFAFADDTAWVTHDRETMQMRVQVSGDFFEFMGLENEPSKDDYVELSPKDVDTGMPEWETQEENPGTVRSRSQGVVADIRRQNVDYAIKYLGKLEAFTWGTEGAQYEKLEGTIRTNVGRIKYKKLPMDGLRQITQGKIMAAARYPLGFIAIDMLRVDALQKPVTILHKQAAGICSAAPLMAFEYFAGIPRWAEVVLVDQLVRWLRAANDKDTGIQSLMMLGMDDRVRWTGSAKDALQLENVRDAGNDHTFFGQMITNLGEFGIHITGAGGMEGTGENIVDGAPEDIRATIMEMCDYHRIWWKEEAVEYIKDKKEDARRTKLMNKVDRRAHSVWRQHLHHRFGAGGMAPGTRRAHQGKELMVMQGTDRTPPVAQGTGGRWAQGAEDPDTQEADGDCKGESPSADGDCRGESPSVQRDTYVYRTRPPLAGMTTDEMAMGVDEELEKWSSMAGMLMDPEEEIMICSDGGFDQGEPRTVMAWMAYKKIRHADGQQKTRPLEGGSNAFKADSENASSYRAEAQGLLAALLRVLHWRDRMRKEGRGEIRAMVRIHLDNESVVQTCGDIADTSQRWNALLKTKDLDVWTHILHQLKQGLKEEMENGKLEVKWHRGHPEDYIQDRSKWESEDWAVFIVDARATQIKREMDELGLLVEEDGLGPNKYPTTMQWGASIRGVAINGNFRKELVKEMGKVRAHRFLRETWNWEEEDISQIEWRHIQRMLDKAKKQKDRVRVLKYITDWLPTLRRLFQRNHCESEQCAICGRGVETIWHILSRCTHPLLIEGREQWVREMVEIVMMALPTDQQEAFMRMDMMNCEGMMEKPGSLEAEESPAKRAWELMWGNRGHLHWRGWIQAKEWREIMGHLRHGKRTAIIELMTEKAIEGGIKMWLQRSNIFGGVRTEEEIRREQRETREKVIAKLQLLPHDPKRDRNILNWTLSSQKRFLNTEYALKKVPPGTDWRHKIPRGKAGTKQTTILNAERMGEIHSGKIVPVSRDKLAGLIAIGVVDKERSGFVKIRIVSDYSRPEGTSLNDCIVIEDSKFMTVRAAYALMRPGYYR